jgi:hypothetical protein
MNRKSLLRDEVRPSVAELFALTATQMLPSGARATGPG